MSTFTKKPDTAEAVQWDGSNLTEVQELFPAAAPSEADEDILAIPLPGWTPTGVPMVMNVAMGQWAILDQNGGYLVMDDETFLKAYEAAG